MEFTSQQAATAAKRKIDAFGEGQQYVKKQTVTYHNPNVNPFRTLPKDAPARATKEGQNNRSSSGPGGYNSERGNHGAGNFGGNFRGRGGGYNSSRGGMNNNMNQGNFNRNFSGAGGAMGGGFNSPMGGGFQGNPMGNQFGGFNRGGMMGGMRGGPGGMRGGRGGMGNGMMGGMPMGGMPMGGMGGMGMPMNMGNMAQMGGAMQGMCITRCSQGDLRNLSRSLLTASIRREWFPTYATTFQSCVLPTKSKRRRRLAKSSRR